MVEEKSKSDIVTEGQIDGEIKRKKKLMRKQGDIGKRIMSMRGENIRTE